MCIKSRLPAFTLLESLVALIVISGSVLVYQALTHSVVSQVNYLSVNDEKNWLLFSQQMWSELEESQFIKVEQDRLYIKKSQQNLSFGKSKSDDFRKTDASGRGYQPLLYGISSADMTAKDKLVTINLSFQSGLKRTFVYAFKEKG